MAIDRPSGEAVEQQRAADAPPPPPPPDTPGAEGFPSRAESKAAAASAADRTTRREDTVDTSDTTPTPDAAQDEQDAPRTDRTQESEASERSEPEAPENGAADSPYDTDHDQGDEREEQPSSSEELTPARSIDDERDSMDASAQSEVVDDRAPHGESPDVREQSVPLDAPVETADDQRSDDLDPPSDRSGTEPEGPPPSSAEGHDGAGAVAEADAEQANDLADAGSTDRQPDIEPAAEPSDDALDTRPDEAGQRSDDPEPADDVLDGAPVQDQAEDADVTADPTGDRSRGYEPAASGPESDSEGGAPGDEARATERRSGLTFMVGDRLARLPEYLDPVRARAWSNEIGDQAPDPADRAGDRIANAENDKDSRFEKLRREGYRSAGDAVETAGKVADRGQDLFPHPPMGRPELNICPPVPATPEFGHPIHDGIDAGNLLTTAMVAGMLIGEGIRWARGRWATMGERL